MRRCVPHRLSDLTDKGIEVVIQKAKRGGRVRKRVCFTWTPELRETIDKALALQRNVRGLTLFCTRDGQPYTGNGFRSITLHDLKAKGVTDFEGEFSKAAGHKSGKMRDVYDRKIERTKPTR